MAWIVLILSGIMEAVWATALGKSDGFTKLTPTLIFISGLALSMAGLAYAMRSIPIGTSYVVWVGIGAVLTVAYTIVVDGEPAPRSGSSCCSASSAASSASRCSTKASSAMVHHLSRSPGRETRSATLVCSSRSHPGAYRQSGSSAVSAAIRRRRGR